MRSVILARQSKGITLEGLTFQLEPQYGSYSGEELETYEVHATGGLYTLIGCCD